MGLDMYLKRQTDVGYWHKANAVHKWMIENICDKNYNFNYEDATLPIEKAEELLGICKRILNAHELAHDWESIAREYLPRHRRVSFTVQRITTKVIWMT